MLLLDGRDLLLLPTLYAVRLDDASDHTGSAGVQHCRDRLVVAARSDEGLWIPRFSTLGRMAEQLRQGESPEKHPYQIISFHLVLHR